MTKRWTINGKETAGLVGSHPVVTQGQTVSMTFKWTPRVDNYLTQYQDIRDLLEYTQRVDHGTYLDQTPWYRERHDRQSLVLEIVPGSSSEGAKGVWGLLVGGTDETVKPVQEAVLSLDILVLAPHSDYASLTDVENAFLIDTDTATYTDPDAGDGPFVGDPEDEPADETAPDARPHSVDDTPGTLPNFTITTYDVSLDIEDDQGALIDSQTVYLSVYNDVGDKVEDTTTDTGQVTVSLRNGQYEIRANSDGYEEGVLNVEVDGSNISDTIRLTPDDGSGGDDGDVGTSLAGIEIHDSPGNARDGEYVNAEEWVEIYGPKVKVALNTSS